MDVMIWYRDVRVLWSRFEVIPRESIPLDERLNALVRASFIIFLIALVVFMDLRVVVIPVAAMVISAIVWEDTVRKQEKFLSREFVIDTDGKLRKLPTPANPTMNRLYGSPGYSSKAADATEPVVQQQMIDSLDAIGFLAPKDADKQNMINRRMNIREFQTTPDMGVVPDRRSDFVKYLYGDLDSNNHKINSIIHPESQLAGKNLAPY